MNPRCGNLFGLRGNVTSARVIGMAGWLSGLCQNLSSALLPFTQSSLRVFRAEPDILLFHSKTGILLKQNLTELNLVEHRRHWENPDPKRIQGCMWFYFLQSVFQCFMLLVTFLHRDFSQQCKYINSMLLSYVCQNGDINETVLLCYINI